ncbi:MAG: 23S rRNA (adenine(2030)-N(6))-methyltransferase RlmJ [Gammaproteobacteria bacterium]|nr:23S rRNA (adenine(2030)-N(6))-methyltransferase RlmJ [Gammaproteobacteria bacterium]
MLSYRHAFHAGNFADVLKHLVLDRILAHLVKKDKPFFCLDTHAGAGGYSLTGEPARRNGEFEAGIGRLWERDDLPAALAEYLAVVREFNPSGRLQAYPGSPYFERRRLRAGDRLVLCELHPAELVRLKSFARKDPRLKVVRGDGFHECIALLPPHERRGLVLIDPSYEIKTDYRRAVEALLGACRRFETGIFALWYPVIERRRIDGLEQALGQSGIRRIRLFELGVGPDARGHGMTASGMIVVNAPWTLADEMEAALPFLADALGRDGGGHYRAFELTGEGP